MEINIGFRWLILTSLVVVMIGGCSASENDPKPTAELQPVTEAVAPTDDGPLTKEIGPPTEDKQPTPLNEGQPPTEKPLTPAPVEELATPYAMEPAAGICGGPFEGELAPVEIWPDAPSPRCLKIARDQRLQVTNQTDTQVTLRLGSKEIELPVGEGIILEAPLGSFLAPGVHVLIAAPFFGPELWLEE